MREFLRYLYVVAAMLMVVVGDVWAGKAKVNAKSDPEEGGYVYVANSAGSYSPNSSTDDATQDGDFWSKKDKDFYLYYKVSDSKYYFKGWYQTDVNWLSQWNSCDANSTTLTTNGQKVTHKADGGATTADYYYYAIFATLHNTTSPSFSTINVDKTTTATVTLKHAHANNVTLSITGDCASDFSVNTTSFYSNQLGTQTITITFNPNCAGTRTANLKITNDNGLPEVNIPLSAVANVLPQTIAWDSQYDENMNVGGTLVVSATASTGQSVTYASSDPSVISVSGNTLTALKEGVATITASQIDGCTYETVHTQLEFKVYNKKTPVFWLMGDPNMESDNLKVEDSRWIKVENVDGMRAVYDPNLLFYSFDGDRVVVTALDAGVATLELIQDPTDAIFGKSRTFTFNITKYTTNTISNDLAIQYMVDDVIPEIDIYTINNMEVPVQVISGDENILKFENGQLKAVGAGITTVTVLQAETNKWVGISASKTIEVIKHTPVFTWNDPVYFNQALIEDYFATSNKDTKISITNQTDREVADLYFSTSDPSDLHTLDLTTYNKGASTKVTVSQEENWYWYAKSEEHTITPIDPNNHVPFVMNTSSRRIALFYDKEDDNGEITCSDGGEIRLNQNSAIVWTANPLYYTIKFTGVPNKLSFDYKKTATSTAIGATGKAFIVYESSDGSSWNEIWTSNGLPDNTDYESISNIQLNPGTRYLKFFFDATYSGYYKNITVTELEEFHAVNEDDETIEVEYLDFEANQVFTSKTKNFNLKYANAGYKVKVESNDSRFTVNPTSINTIGGCKYGKENISVTYRSTTPYETTGNNSYIVISDELAELNGHRDTVYLRASSYKPEQTLEWRTDFKAVEKPIIRVKEGQITDAATAKSGLPVTYISSNTDVIAVSDDGRILIPLAAGEVTITATQVGNETWLPVSDTKTFIVTDKTVQYIGWGDDLTGLVLGDADMTLTAKVYLRDEETQAYIYSEERTNLLQYSVGDVNVVTVSGNVLSIKGVGQTTATVTAPGDGDYAEATLTVPVRVRTASAGCEDVLLLNHPDEVGFFAYNTNEIVQGPFGIDKEKGVPGSLSFQHRGASWDLGIQYYGGKIKAQYVTDDNSTWTDAIEVTPIEDQATFESEIYLPRNATQIRFVRPSGAVGYHYVSNIQVHPAQYLEAPVEIDFGEIHVGSNESKNFDVDYSNIKDVVTHSTSSLDVTVSPGSFGICSGFGQQTITVTWIPSQVNDNAQETVTLRDNTSGMQRDVVLKAKVVKGTQDLNWQDIPEDAISNCGDIEFPKQTTAHIDIIWEVIDGKDVADFNGNGELELYKQGTITVKGSNTGNANYDEFYIEYVFSIEYEPIFVGTENTEWNNPNNWSVCRVPSEEDVVTIQAPVDLTTSVKVEGIKLDAGTVHIDYKGGLTVGKDGVSVTAGSITIDNTPEGAGYLRVHPDATNQLTSQVKVNYVTTAYNSGNPRDEVWQYVGAPGEGMQMSSSDRDYTLIYHWNEQKGWLQHYDDSLEPFVGYALTQNKADRGEFELWANPIMEDKEISLTQTPKGMNGDNLFVNSYLAPIDVARIDPKNDYTGIEGTFYLFNSGSWNQWQNQGGKDHMERGVSPGQYYAITPGSAALINSQEDQTTIPPMQGAYVIATNNEAKLRLIYKNHVYDVEDPMNRPMRSPKLEDDNFMRVRMQVGSKNSGADRMYVIQYAECTSGYDNGYDARNILAEGQANIYTNEQDGEMEISVSDQIDETYIGFSAGKDSEYTLRFTSVVGELYLKDLETETVMAVLDGEEYIFNATPNTKNDRRFLLLDHKPEQGGVSTDVETISSTKAWIVDNVVYVTNAPINTELVVYTMSGVVVTSFVTTTAYATIDLANMPVGVYMLRVNDEVYKFVCK